MNVEFRNVTSGSDGWTTGDAYCGGIKFRFNVKHYAEPSDYGIGGGRASKLWLALIPNGDGRAAWLLSYQRGWDRGYGLRGRAIKESGVAEEAMAVYRALLKKYN